MKSFLNSDREILPSLSVSSLAMSAVVLASSILPPPNMPSSPTLMYPLLSLSTAFKYQIESLPNMRGKC